jgi:hypothetical protein
LYEHRGDTRTATEVRKIVKALVAKTSTKKLSFLQLACSIFDKPYSDFIFTDAKTREDALAEAEVAAAAIEEAQCRLQVLKDKQENELIQDQLDRERESQLTGVAGKAAFFKRKMVVDETSINATKVDSYLYRNGITL